MSNAAPRRREATPVAGTQPDAEVLRIDKATLDDLEVFGSQAPGASLFELCNGCRSEGGERVLRRRMARPWATAEHIRATQASLTFITAERPAFDRLPSAYAIKRVARYLREALPVIAHRNVVGFGLAAVGMWADDDSRYVRILTGVSFVREFLGSLGRFVGQDAPAAAAGPVGRAPSGKQMGELAPLLAELRSLLTRPRLARIPDLKAGGWFWKVLSLDQDFRLHERESLARLVALVHEIDALVALADVTARCGFVMPDIETGAPRVAGEGLVHPCVAEPVANAVTLDAQHRVLFLTGPNMAGKTTYLRAIAVALYFAHLGMGVPARRFAFVPLQQLFSSISISDDLHAGVSYFRAEALRIRAIAAAMAAGQRVVALLDEPFKGTNVKDAMDASLAILERFARSERCLFVFSSHLIELGEQVRVTAGIDYRNFEAEESGGRLRFDYRLRPGISAQRLGMRVLREEGVFDLLDTDPDPGA